MSVHIYPINDTDTHTMSTDCECGPTKDKHGYHIHVPFGDNPEQLQWTFEITDNNEH